MGRRRPLACLDGNAAGDLDFMVAGCLPLFDDAAPPAPPVVFEGGFVEGRLGEDMI